MNKDWQNTLQQYLKDNKYKLGKGEKKLYKSLSVRKRVWEHNTIALWDDNTTIHYYRLWECITDKMFNHLSKLVSESIDIEILGIMKIKK